MKSFCLIFSFNSALLVVNKDDACEGLCDDEMMFQVETQAIDANYGNTLNG